MDSRRLKKTRPPMTDAQQNRFLKIILLLVIFAVCWIFFSPTTGFFSLMKQRKELQILQQETQVLSEKNKAIQKEIDKIKNDPEYLEELARRDHNLIKKNETVFDFSRKKKAEKQKVE